MADETEPTPPPGGEVPPNEADSPGRLVDALQYLGRQVAALTGAVERVPAAAAARSTDATLPEPAAVRGNLSARDKSPAPTATRDIARGPEPQGKSERLAAAMDHLGRQVVVLTGAVTRATANARFGPAGRPGPVPTPAASRRGLAGAPLPVAAGMAGMGSIAGVFTPLFAMLVGKITLALAPIAVLGAAVAAQSSGFSAFLASTRLLGTVLGTLLLPAFAVLGAGVYALSGYIMDKLMPVLGDYYDSIITGAIDGVQKFEAALITAAAYLRELSGAAGKSKAQNDERMKLIENQVQAGKGPGGAKDWILRQIDAVRSEIGDSIGATRKLILGTEPETNYEENLKRIQKRDKQAAQQIASRNIKPGVGALMGGAAAAAPAPQTMTDRFREGLRAFAAEMRANMGPQAHYTTAADIYKQATTAGQMSPFQRMMLTLTNTAIGYLEKAANNSRPAISH